MFDWAYLPLATLPVDALDAALDQSVWTHGLLVRRSLSDGALAYFTTFGLASTGGSTGAVSAPRSASVRDRSSEYARGPR